MLRDNTPAPIALKALFFLDFTMPLVYNAGHRTITISVNKYDPPGVVALAVDHFKAPYLNTVC